MFGGPDEKELKQEIGMKKDAPGSKPPKGTIDADGDALEERLARLTRENEELRQQVRERDIALEELRKSQGLFISFIENLPLNIFGRSLDGHFILVNKAYCRTVGKPKEEILGKTNFDLHPPELARVYREEDREVVKTRRTLIAENDFRPIEGEPIYVHVIKTPLYDHRGHVIGVWGLFWDITDRKRAETSLKERMSLLALSADVGKAFVRESRLAEILTRCAEALVRRLDAAFVRVWVLNPSDDMLEPRADAGAETDVGRAYGRAPLGEGGIGKIASERKPFHTNSASRDPRVPDTEWIKKEKIEAFAGFPLIVGEKPVGAIAIFSRKCFTGAVLEALESVSDQIAIGIARGMSDEALRESEERFREMAEMLPEVVFEADAEGRVTFVNENAFDYFGYSRGEIEAGVNCIDFISPGDHARAAETSKRLIKGENVEAAEYKVVRKNGSTFPAVIQTTLIRREGELTGFRGILVDVTEKKRIELQLRQAWKMEAIGTLAGGVAHDFNNILSAIMGYSEISLLDVEEDTRLHRHLRKIMRAGERARDLVKQILTFSRRNEREVTPVRIIAVTEEALNLLRATLPSTIKIDRKLRSEANVMANPTRIHQVLMNLCANAGHAMREAGGVLEVGLEDVTLDGDFVSRHPDLTPGPYVELSVSDTGDGMTPSVMERIFDPFFTTKKLGEGTGMGLAVVHGIVKSHGGEITVRSAPGEGSVFRVYLPVIEGGELKKEMRPPPLPMGRGRVLFVDDEEFQVDIAAQMLERLGYEATTRTDGVEALELFRERPDRFDLVMTDMTMPVMTGDALARELMKIRPDIPVILCTGYSEKMSEKKARESGIRGFILKPIVIRKIAEAIREALGEGGGDSDFKPGRPVDATSSGKVGNLSK